MREIADEINSFRGVGDVYIYFNYDINAQAIRNAKDFKKIAAPRPFAPSYH